MCSGWSGTGRKIAAWATCVHCRTGTSRTVLFRDSIELYHPPELPPCPIFRACTLRRCRQRHSSAVPTPLQVSTRGEHCVKLEGIQGFEAVHDIDGVPVDASRRSELPSRLVCAQLPPRALVHARLAACTMHIARARAHNHSRRHTCSYLLAHAPLQSSVGHATCARSHADALIRTCAHQCTCVHFHSHTSCACAHACARMRVFARGFENDMHD